MSLFNFHSLCSELIPVKKKREEQSRKAQSLEILDLHLGSGKHFIILCRKLTSVNIQTAGHNKVCGANVIGQNCGVTYTQSSSHK